MGKFDGILLCSDFDGTCAIGGAVPEENIKAIKYFRENGGLFTFASGRPHDFLVSLFGDQKFGAPLICLNGAVIYDIDTRKMLSERMLSGFDKEKSDRIIKEVGNVTFVGLFSKEGSDFVDVGNGQSIPDDIYDKLYKIAFRVSGDESDGYRAKQIITEIMKGHCVERSSSNYIEVLEPASTKAPNTLALKKLVGAHTLVCVGDYENDIEMIKSADIGYAVGNAIDSVKAVADRVTVSCDKFAIAKIVEEL